MAKQAENPDEDNIHTEESLITTKKLKCSYDKEDGIGKDHSAHGGTAEVAGEVGVWDNDEADERLNEKSFDDDGNGELTMDGRYIALVCFPCLLLCMSM